MIYRLYYYDQGEGRWHLSSPTLTTKPFLANMQEPSSEKGTHHEAAKNLIVQLSID